MAELVQMRIRHPRPVQLSDPDVDFSPEELAELHSTSDEDLEWFHLQSLLGPYSPAGTYEETVYYLPLAFEFLWTADENRIDLAPAVVGFVSKNARQLEEEGLLDAARKNLRALLAHWSEDFEILHLDREACRAKGSGREYADGVRNNHEICVLLSELVRFKTHSDLAIEFVESLAQHDGDPHRAAWFLELARCRAEGSYTLPRKPFEALLRNPDRLEAAVDAVLKRDDSSQSPTYWNDTLQQIWQ